MTYACPNCGDDCWHSEDGVDGYPWCRPCGEHHRPPECAVDAQGRSLGPCGCPWGVLFDPAVDHDTLHDRPLT